jgi:hypothetical protein
MLNTHFLLPQSAAAVRVAECNRQHLLSGAVLVLGWSAPAGLAAQAKAVEPQERASQLVQAGSKWSGGISEVLKSETVASLHVIASQSPMTFLLADHLVIKMRTYQHFEKNSPKPVCSHFALPKSLGFGIELGESRIESRNTLT